MARNARVDVGGHVYHVLNRAVGRATIFESRDDYRLFHELLLETTIAQEMRVLAFALMPNHWHLALYPHADGDMGTFMHRITNTHTRIIHARTGTTGTGPLYQGRYKSFLVEDDQHLLEKIGDRHNYNLVEVL